MTRRDPFRPMTRRRRLAAVRDRTREALLRPFRGTRIAPHREGPPNLLILAVDTLRRDHVATDLASTPALDAFARAGTTFDDVTAPSPWTLPSFTSALTGLLPSLHGAGMQQAPGLRNMAEQPPAPLSPGTSTLASHLARLGYTTGAVYSNPFVEFGLAESFRYRAYRNHAAADVAARALEWIRRRGDRPFCLFVLFNDPHEPTLPPPRHWPASLDGATEWSDAALCALSRWGNDLAAPHLGRLGTDASPRDRAALAVKRGLYSGAVAAVDAALGAVLDRLEGWGLDRNTLVSVFSDHGEEFREHADFARLWDHDPRDLQAVGHGHALFQEVLHVPWLVRGPGVPVGTRRTCPVSLADFAPTACRLLGVDDLPLPADAHAPLLGRPLDLRAEADPERLLLSEDVAYGPDLVSLRRGPWKLQAHRRGDPLGLFRLDEDPNERVDRRADAPGILAELVSELGAWREATPADGGKGGDWEDRDDEIRRRLKDLGYGE